MSSEKAQPSPERPAVAQTSRLRVRRASRPVFLKAARRRLNPQPGTAALRPVGAGAFSAEWGGLLRSLARLAV